MLSESASITWWPTGANWRHLEPLTRQTIQRDIREAIAEGRYGMEMDLRDWQRVLELPEDMGK